jgi:hypothetical protein
VDIEYRFYAEIFTVIVCETQKDLILTRSGRGCLPKPAVHSHVR